ncbi:hypothetical protein CFIMG_005832RA [Ceratocystis fimbriata CBS 114723]|uniref:SP-RING-type domain-containing protein n=1 Tax=Ceratocystis fimbriata CBS 114723 TaxID=1035309 RepID=A0A2C5X359_9PEZI|nr:hypothetical protein CFIMG_005832RA [Ceratocystis fimbriata CBS 114723]
MLSEGRRRRLMNNSNSSPRRSSGLRDQESDDDDMEPQRSNSRGLRYEEMAGPPNASSAEAMKKLVASRESQRIIEESRTAMDGINKAIAAVNDAMLSQRKNVVKIQRQVGGGNGGVDGEEKGLWGENEMEERDEYLANTQQKAESALQKLADSSIDLTTRAEVAFRQLIDVIAETEDFNLAMESAAEQVRVASRQREILEAEQARARAIREQQNEDGLEAEEASEDQKPVVNDGALEASEIAPFSPLKDTLLAAVHAKDGAYNSMSLYQRYATNNDYAAFRRQLHRSIYDDAREVPDKKRWFDEDGRPVLPTREALLGIESDTEMRNGSDDELVIQRVKQDFKCPLSLRELENPYGTSKCIHVFEKEAIFAYVAQSGGNATVQCPQSGCSATFTRSDLIPNQEVLIQLERRKRRRARDESDNEEEQEDADDYEYASINTTAIDVSMDVTKREPR